MGLARPDRPAGDSRPVRSNQPGLHPGLASCVRKHADTPWRQPVPGATREAFARVEAMRRAHWAGRPVVLDSGCGTGESTARLAQRHPEAWVVGIDRSAVRLARVGADRGPAGRGRVLWVRAELASFWRLALAAGWSVSHHYLLYPNPWPKAAHLKRRWHGHPVFPALLALGGRLELRSNWKTYVEEFARAVELLTGLAPGVSRLDDAGAPLSPFERKYLASGHARWRWRDTLPKTSI